MKKKVLSSIAISFVLASCGNFMETLNGVNTVLGAVTGSESVGESTYNTSSSSSSISSNTTRASTYNISSSPSNIANKGENGYHKKLSNGDDYTYSRDANGSVIELWQHPDGSSTVKSQMRCYSCKGSLKCNICNGTGNSYYSIGRYLACPSCNKTGKCATCNGSGFCTPMTTTYQPGEAEAYLQQIRADRKSARSGKSSSSSSNKKTSSSCPKCGGRKYESTSYNYSADNKSYLNISGTVCPYCSKSSKHYHYPCSSCGGTGRK